MQNVRYIYSWSQKCQQAAFIILFIESVETETRSKGDYDITSSRQVVKFLNFFEDFNEHLTTGPTTFCIKHTAAG